MTGPARIDALLAALSREDATPRYLRLAAALGDLIERGQFRPGDALPSERELCVIAGYARVTVRKAIEELMRRGAVSRRHGSGTFVASRIEQPLSMLASFTEDIRRRGAAPGSLWLSKVLARPAPAEAMALGLGPFDAVLRISRVRTADSEPLAIETACVPATLLNDPDAVGDSLYAALTARGFEPANGVQRLSAGLATREEAKLLAIPAGSAILRIERRAFLANGKPLEFTVSAYRGDRYDFVATLQGGLAARGARP